MLDIQLVIFLVVVAFFSPVRIWGEDFNDSFPTCTFFLFLKWTSAHAHQFHWKKYIYQARISSQGLSQLRQHWPSVSWWVSCDLVFSDRFPRSRTMPGQHSQPTPTLSGQGCMHVLSFTCHLQFWQNDCGLLCATAGTGGGTDTRERVSTES